MDLIPEVEEEIFFEKKVKRKHKKSLCV